MPSTLGLETIVVAANEQVSCPLGEESAILNLKNSVYYGLNPVGASIWNLLQRPRTVRQIRDAILEEYEVEPQRCESDLMELLETMFLQGLVQVVNSKSC